MKTKTTTDLLAAAWREESRRLDGVARGHDLGLMPFDERSRERRLLRTEAGGSAAFSAVAVVLLLLLLPPTPCRAANAGADRAGAVHVVHQMLEAR